MQKHYLNLETIPEWEQMGCLVKMIVIKEVKNAASMV